MTPLYQNDRRWKDIVTGHGPSRLGATGCVVVSLTMAARELGTRAGLIPPHTNNSAIAADCFEHWDEKAKKLVRGDELLVGKAAPIFGLEAPDDGVVAGAPGDAQVLEAVRAALKPDHEGNAPGMALLRIAFDDDPHGKHTILATALDLYTNVVRCLDPAIGLVTLGFPQIETLGVWGKGDVRKYHVVGVRPIRKAKN